MTNPLTVDVELALVLPLGDGNDYHNIKPLLRINGLNPSGDVEEQLKLALTASSQAWASIDENIEVAISNILSTSVGSSSISDRIKNLEKARITQDAALKSSSETIRNMADKIKSLDKSLIEALSSVKDK